MRRPARTRLVAAPLVAAGLLAALLTACAPAQPAEDDSALSAWADEVIAAGGGSDGMAGTMSEDASTEGIRQDFAAPTALTSVELRCRGTDRAAFTLRYTGTDGAVTQITQDIVCADGAYRTPIAVPTAVGELAAIAANATSPDGQGYWVAIPQR